MNTDNNNALARRYIEEVANGADIDHIDEFTSPEYTEVYPGERCESGAEGARKQAVACLEPVRGCRAESPDFSVGLIARRFTRSISQALTMGREATTQGASGEYSPEVNLHIRGEQRSVTPHPLCACGDPGGRAGGYGAAEYITLNGKRYEPLEHDTSGKWWMMSTRVPKEWEGNRTVRLVGEAFDTAHGPHYEVYDDFEDALGFAPPEINWVDGVVPYYGTAGTQVTINGSHFGDMTTQDGSVIVTPFLRGQISQVLPAPVPVLSWSDTRIVIQIPDEYTKPQTMIVRVRRLTEPNGYFQESRLDPMFKITEGGRPPEQLRPASRIWGTDSVGVTSPATDWYLAEGSTGAGFETWILVQNPNAFEAKVTLTYITDSGEGTGPQVTLAANSRTSVNVAQLVPYEPEVSVKVVSNQPIIVERSMYGEPR